MYSILLKLYLEFLWGKKWHWNDFSASIYRIPRASILVSTVNFFLKFFFWIFIPFFQYCFCSINHEFKEWDEKNPNVPTCNQNTKNMVQGSTVPQEVDKDKDIVFTYDVTFKVSSCNPKNSITLLISFVGPPTTITRDCCRRVISSGHPGGILTFSWTMIRFTGFQSLTPWWLSSSFLGWLPW